MVLLWNRLVNLAVIGRSYLAGHADGHDLQWRSVYLVRVVEKVTKIVEKPAILEVGLQEPGLVISHVRPTCLAEPKIMLLS